MLYMINISAFSFSNNLDSMNTKGLLMMNDHIKFNVCKSMSDYNMKLIDTNDVDGRVDDGINEFDKDLHDTDVFVFAVPEHTGHYSAVFKNAMDWLVVKSNMNNNLGTSYGFSHKPIILITFTPSKKAGNRHFDMTKHLLEKMGGNVVKSFVKNDCWDNLYRENMSFISEECKYINEFKKDLVTIEKHESKQWKNKDDMISSYNNWKDKWK